MNVPLEIAEKVARHLIEQLSPHCDFIGVAGSTRRRVPMVHDLEIVAIPKTGEHLYHIEGIVNYKFGRPEIGRFPSKLTRIRNAKVAFDGATHTIDLELLWPNAQTLGMCYFIRTGPKEFVQKALGHWKKITGGGYSEDCILHKADHSIVPTPFEEDVFQALGINFVPPEKRLRT